MVAPLSGRLSVHIFVSGAYLGNPWGISFIFHTHPLGGVDVPTFSTTSLGQNNFLAHLVRGQSLYTE